MLTSLKIRTPVGYVNQMLRFYRKMLFIDIYFLDN